MRIVTDDCNYIIRQARSIEGGTNLTVNRESQIIEKPQAGSNEHHTDNYRDLNSRQSMPVCGHLVVPFSRTKFEYIF